MEVDNWGHSVAAESSINSGKPVITSDNRLSGKQTFFPASERQPD